MGRSLFAPNAPAGEIAFRQLPSGDFSAWVPSPQPAPPGKAVSGRSGSQKIAWFQKGLPVGDLPSVRPEYPILGLWRAKVSGRFA